MWIARFEPISLPVVCPADATVAARISGAVAPAVESSLRSIYRVFGGSAPAPTAVKRCARRQSATLITTQRSRRNAVFRALADPTRREILGLLRSGRYTVGEIAGNFRTSRPAISKHLRVLRSAGLVVSHRDGTAQICQLNARPLRTIDEWLQDYQAFWGETMRNLKQYVEEKQ